MSGVRLGELDSGDFLDVLHFMFEDDIMSSKTKEELDVKDSLRTTVYRDFYGKEYNYASGGSNSGVIGMPLDEDLSIGEEDDIPVPLDPKAESARALKPRPFTPATPIDEGSRLPFGMAIDAPLA